MSTVDLRHVVRQLLAENPGKSFFDLRPLFKKLVQQHNARGQGRITVKDIIRVAQAVRFIDAGETPAHRARHDDVSGPEAIAYESLLGDVRWEAPMSTAHRLANRDAARLHLAVPDAARNVAQQVRNEVMVAQLGLDELFAQRPDAAHPEHNEIERDVRAALEHILQLMTSLHSGAA